MIEIECHMSLVERNACKIINLINKRVENQLINKNQRGEIGERGEEKKAIRIKRIDVA